MGLSFSNDFTPIFFSLSFMPRTIIKNLIMTLINSINLKLLMESMEDLMDPDGME